MEFETLAAFAQPVGLMGVAFYLGSYTALQLGFIRGQSYTYATLNLVAASCILFSMLDSLWTAGALSQSLWIFISLVGVTRLYVISRRVRFSEEEEALLRSKLPFLPRHLARRVLNHGMWVDALEGAELTREGEPVRELAYIAAGAAAVTLDGHRIGVVGADSFIGEMTSLSGAPASATVTLTAPSRCFILRAEQLRALAAKEPELKHALEISFAGDTRAKLLRANESRLAAEAARDDRPAA